MGDPISVLDDPIEALFNRLASLATKALRIPVAFVTFLEPTRQVFRGRCVVEGPLLDAHETPISHSICHLVATRREALIIDDTRKHPLVLNNPVVEEAKVYAYAGIPLFDPDGKAVGAFCAIDYQPHHWTQEDVEMLTTLASQVMSELTLRFSMELLKQKEAHRTLTHREDRHDLRTPLNALYLGIQSVRLMGPLNEEQSECLALAERNSEALGTMLDKMLDIANLEGRGSQAIHVERCQSGGLLAIAMDQVALLAESKGIRLVDISTESLCLEVDRDKIVRVLVNLLGNAIKFTSTGGHVWVRAEGDASALSGPSVRFTVRDEGIGIAPDHLGKLFADGFRVDPALPTRHSTGLGLAFCKRVVETHAGKIGVESALQKGSVFFLTLPQKAAQGNSD